MLLMGISASIIEVSTWIMARLLDVFRSVGTPYLNLPQRRRLGLLLTGRYMLNFSELLHSYLWDTCCCLLENGVFLEVLVMGWGYPIR